MTDWVERLRASFDVSVDAPLGACTTYRVGGTARALVAIDRVELLPLIADWLADNWVEVLVLGNGSNLLVSDQGFDGLVIVPSCFKDVEISGETVIAGAGVSFPTLARKVAASGLAGLAWAVGVPGSVGGAVKMNAGGHGSETREVLSGAEVVNLRTGEVSWWSRDELGFGYRHSAIGDEFLVTRARFELMKGDPEELAREMSAIVKWRRENQPGGQNAGSVFKNPSGRAAAQLIEEAGFKGFRLGSAQVSPKHANFIQADAGGSADDVYRLIGMIQTAVFERSGVRLEREVRVVGFKDPF